MTRIFVKFFIYLVLMIAFIIVITIYLSRGYMDFLKIIPVPFILLILAFLQAKDMNRLEIELDSFIIKNIFLDSKKIRFSSIKDWCEKPGLRLSEKLLQISMDDKKIVISSISDWDNYITLLNRLILDYKDKEIIRK